METYQSSHFLLRLYDSVFSQPLQQFKDRALKLLQRDVPFDTALWAGGLVKGTSVERLHFTHLFELPANFLDTWSPRKEEDGLLKRILSEPGKAFTEADLMDQKPRREDRELYKKHSQCYQIARVMSLARIEPVTGLFCAISLYRKDAQQPFSREEGAFFETGVPHLMQAAVLNQLFHYRSSQHQTLSQGHGLCDQEGYLHMADSHLIEKFREEWPNWSGGSLPKPIQAIATQQAEDHYIGSAIVVEFHPTKDLVWLRVRAVENLEKLSTREAQLLPLLAAGKSYKEIGSQLHIAHSTVNKHVLSIYKKLGVSSKAELGSIYLSFQK